ncbi:hypothetical protein GH714_042605 [Hevea brasiliensis]|uniref:Uncharacterized protein n=1 Tax=Hevea brasiliensis TaxID=3981 RepID=A0A6A6JYV6_HEVBR|nr:hypothetical protein GH714_042605 [Hevea brasiliensis]
MKVQPQLLLLQKTMVLVEGICRQLAPDMNLWKIAELWVQEHGDDKRCAEKFKKSRVYRYTEFYDRPGLIMSSGRAKSYVGWLTTVMMLISLSCSECMYSAFGGVVLHSELKVAALMFARMCFFALFQLFSGALIDHYGGKLMLPIAALCTCVGVLFQMLTLENPQGHVSVRMKFAEVVGSMRDILATKDTLYASIIGGMMFGMFFATAGFLVYKLDSRVAYLVSMWAHDSIYFGAWYGVRKGYNLLCDRKWCDVYHRRLRNFGAYFSVGIL